MVSVPGAASFGSSGLSSDCGAVDGISSCFFPVSLLFFGFCTGLGVSVTGVLGAGVEGRDWSAVCLALVPLRPVTAVSTGRSGFGDGGGRS